MGLHLNRNTHTKNRAQTNAGSLFQQAVCEQGAELVATSRGWHGPNDNVPETGFALLFTASMIASFLPPQRFLKMRSSTYKRCQNNLSKEAISSSCTIGLQLQQWLDDMADSSTAEQISWLGQNREEEAGAVTSEEEATACWMCDGRLTQIWSREHGVQATHTGRPCWGGVGRGRCDAAADGAAGKRR